VKLRPYQEQAIERLRGEVRAGRRSVLCVLPTGGGKTVIFSSIVGGAVERSRRCMIVAHRIELIDQAARKLVDAGIPEGEIGIVRAGDRRRRPSALVQVASVDSLRTRTVAPCSLVIVDEAHRALAQSYQRLREDHPDAVHLGFTATPVRGDGKGLGAAYDSMVLAAPVSQLVAEGYLVAPRVLSVPPDRAPDLSRVKTTAGDYDQRQLGEVMSEGRLVGDIVEHWEKHAKGRRTVGFAVTVEHSKQIVERFRERGHAAEHLDGTTPADQRAAILGRLERGETLIVINVGVLTEGWDQPSAKCLILARPTKSLGLYLQMAGRILRPWQGVSALILDHAGCALEHGLPHHDREWELNPPRRRTGKNPECAKMCPACFAVMALGVRVCPECDAELPWREVSLDETAGELVEVDAARIVKPSAALAAWDTMVEAWREENRERMGRGLHPYKPGMVWHRWQREKGRQPPKGHKRPKWTAEEQAFVDAATVAASEIAW